MGIFRRRNKDKSSVRRSVAGQGRSANFSYYQNRDDTDRNKRGAKTLERKRSVNLHHLPSILAVIVIVVCLMYAMTLTDNPKVIIVNQQDEAVQSFLRPQEVYQEAGSSVLKNSLLNKTKITLNTDSVAQKLQEQFPEATDIAVAIPLVGRRPVIYMRVAEPVILLNTPSGSYVVDEKGRAIVSIADAPNAQNLTLLSVNDQTGLDIQTGQQALPKNDISFISEVKKQLESANLKVADVTLPPLANELHVRIDGVPYYVKFNLVGYSREQVGTYLAVKQRLEQDKTTPAEYIDVRVSERAYYK